MAKKQLCWTCKNACGNCNWSANLKPVKGWTAREIVKQDSGVCIETYHIEKCPQYMPDNPPKPIRKKGKSLTNGEKNMITTLHNNGMTITEIAHKLNVSRNTASKYSKKV